VAGTRGPQVLALSPGDITVVTRQTVVDGIPVTGNLRPIESVDVRARIDGDLDGVYVREGDIVHTGQLIARFESSEQESSVQSANADKVAAQGELSTAEWHLRQSQDLYKAGAIAESDLRGAQSSVETARAKLAAANARLRSTSIGNRDTRVLSPTTGTVEKRLAEVGEHMSRGAVMFTIVRNDILELAAAVPEKRANAVQRGQRVHFEASGLSFDGRVARLSPTVDPASRSITVYVQVPNSTGALKGNTFTTGTVMSRLIPNALVIPLSGLHQTAQGKQVAYKIVRGAVDTAAVTVGVIDDRSGIAEVLSGLVDGDSVISGNVGALGTGMKVQVLGGGGRQGGSGRPAQQPPAR